MEEDGVGWGVGGGKDDGVISWMGRWKDDGKRNDGMNQSGGVDFRDFTPNDPITGLVQCSTPTLLRIYFN